MKVNQIDEKGLKQGLWIEASNDGYIYEEGLYSNDKKQGVWLYVFDKPDASIDIVELYYDYGVNLGREISKTVIPSEEIEYLQTVRFIDFSIYEGESIGFIY